MRHSALILTLALLGCARPQEPPLPGPAGMEHAAASRHACPMHGSTCPMAGGAHAAGAGHGGHRPSCPDAAAPQPTAPETSVPEAEHGDHGASLEPSEQVERGREIFHSRGNCYTCHGRNARGTALAPNLGDEEWLHADGSASSLRRVITSGVPRPRVHPAAMPRMGGAALTDRDIDDVIEYLISLQG